MPKTEPPPLTLGLALWTLVGTAINLACVLGGLCFLAYALFMTPDYPGEQHNLQIIGMLLLILGVKK